VVVVEVEKECFVVWWTGWTGWRRVGVETVAMEVESAAFGLPATLLQTWNQGRARCVLRAAKIPMELGTERAAGPGESGAPNSELQWVWWLRKQQTGTYT